MKRRPWFASLSFVLLGAGCASPSGDAVPSSPRDSGALDSSADTQAVADTRDDVTVDDTTNGTTDTQAAGDTSVAVDTAADTAVTPDTGSGCATDHHPGDECDLIAQNCAGTQTCEYDAAATHNRCANRALGSAVKGEACTADTDCDRGLFCYANHCSPACCAGDNSNCGAGGSCNVSLRDPSTMAISYHLCSYSANCHPFEYDCPSDQICLFTEAPNGFKCELPSAAGGIAVKPGGACSYINECGESQVCTKLTSDAGTGNSCFLTCWLMTPSGFAPGTMPGGRFPANGTCTVGGTSYGTCTAVGGIGGGLGLCLK